MQKQTVEFAVETAKDGTITIGKSVILQPKTNYDGRKKTHWFDDSKLLKSNKK